MWALYTCILKEHQKGKEPQTQSPPSITDTRTTAWDDCERCKWISGTQHLVSLLGSARKVQIRKTKRLALQDTYATTQRAPILPDREKDLVGRCMYSPLSPSATERARSEGSVPRLHNARLPRRRPTPQRSRKCSQLCSRSSQADEINPIHASIQPSSSKSHNQDQ